MPPDPEPVITVHEPGSDSSDDQPRRGRRGAPNVSYTYNINAPALPPVEPSRTQMPPEVSTPSPLPVAQPPGPVSTPPAAEPASPEPSRDRGRPSEADLRAEAAAERVQRRQLQETLTARDAELAAVRADAERREAAARADGDARSERLRQRFVDAELRAHAAVSGIVDLDLIPLIDRSTIAVDDDGNVTGIETAVTAFKAAKPAFFRTESPPAPAPAAASPPPVPTGSARPAPAPEPNPAPTNVRELSKQDYQRAKREGLAALRGRY